MTKTEDRSGQRVSPRSLLDLTFLALQEELVAAGVSAAHARTLWRALYDEIGAHPVVRDDFPAPLRRWAAQLSPDRFATDSLETITETTDHDRLARKFLLRLRDGQTIETVLMRYPRRFTACVSTQVGCAMGCVFCATGQMGFVRDLKPGEIVAQVLHGKRAVHGAGAPLRNVVLMGMGEPLNNYDAVMTALEIITDNRGMNIGPSCITISTVGVVPAILRLAEEKQPYNLAVSLHAANETERFALVPASRRWPLGQLVAACRSYVERTGRRIFFEWTLIAGVNDSPGHARDLARLLEGIDAHVNLIPLNPTGRYCGAATAPAVVARFQQSLTAAGLPVTVRQKRGIDVVAGCGQLSTERTLS